MCHYAIYRRNARVIEMQNFTPAYTKGWTYVRTYGRLSRLPLDPIGLGHPIKFYTT